MTTLYCVVHCTTDWLANVIIAAQKHLLADATATTSTADSSVAAATTLATVCAAYGKLRAVFPAGAFAQLAGALCDNSSHNNSSSSNASVTRNMELQGALETALCLLARNADETEMLKLLQLLLAQVRALTALCTIKLSKRYTCRRDRNSTS
jgi:hypothetical protein